MKNKVLIVMATLFICNIAFAAETTHGEIRRIHPMSHSSGELIQFNLKNDTSCNPNNRYYYFKLDSEAKKAWYSMILAADNTGKSISVSIESCPTSGGVPVRYIYQTF